MATFVRHSCTFFVLCVLFVGGHRENVTVRLYLKCLLPTSIKLPLPSSVGFHRLLEHARELGWLRRFPGAGGAGRVAKGAGRARQLANDALARGGVAVALLGQGDAATRKREAVQRKFGARLSHALSKRIVRLDCGRTNAAGGGGSGGGNIDPHGVRLPDAGWILPFEPKLVREPDERFRKIGKKLTEPLVAPPGAWHDGDQDTQDGVPHVGRRPHGSRGTATNLEMGGYRGRFRKGPGKDLFRTDTSAGLFVAKAFAVGRQEKVDGTEQPSRQRREKAQRALIVDAHGIAKAQIGNVQVDGATASQTGGKVIERYILDDFATAFRNSLLGRFHGQDVAHAGKGSG